MAPFTGAFWWRVLKWQSVAGGDAGAVWDPRPPQPGGPAERPRGGCAPSSTGSCDFENGPERALGPS